MRTIFLFSILLTSLLPAQPGPFPLPDSIGGWMKSDSEMIYSGTDLFKLIDGGADIFFEYGFQRVVVQRYSDRNENSLDMEIYEMKDSSSAYGIFSHFTSRTGTRFPGLSEAFSGAEFLLIRKGRFYISITGSNSLKAIQEGIILLGRFIDASIASAGKPALVNAFERTAERSVVYFKGNLALYTTSRLSLGGNFNFEDGIRYEQGTGTITIFRYTDSLSCQKNYEVFMQSFIDDSTVLHQCMKNFIVLVRSNNTSERDRTMKNIAAVLNDRF